MMLTLLVACLLIYKLDLPEWLYLLDPPWDPIGSPGAGARRRKGYAFLARSLLTSISSSDVLTGRACARESSTRTDIHFCTGGGVVIGRDLLSKFWPISPV